VTGDPVDAHVAALGRALRGPARMRRSMLAETRDGLRDAADATGCAARAVREFGTVAELAPQYQAELTAAQGRRTAVLVAVLFPILLIGWHVLWTHGVAWTSTGPPPPLVGAMARGQDVASAVVAALALAVLVATLRRRSDPRLLAAGAGGVGLAGALFCGGAAVVMNVANGPATAEMLASNPLAAPSMLLSGLALVAVLVTTGRALRVAAHDPCRRPPPRAPHAT
jgi:hypothetical protein